MALLRVTRDSGRTHDRTSTDAVEMIAAYVAVYPCSSRTKMIRSGMNRCPCRTMMWPRIGSSSRGIPRSPLRIALKWIAAKSAP